MTAIYNIDVRTESENKNRSSKYYRAFESPVRAFNFIDEIIHAAPYNEVVWSYDLDRSCSDIININGEGMLFVHSSDETKSKGTVTITIHKIYCLMEDDYENKLEDTTDDI